MNQISEEDKAVIRDMHEKFECCLKKYEGFAVQVIATFTYSESSMKTSVENRLVKLVPKH